VLKQKTGDISEATPIGIFFTTLVDRHEQSSTNRHHKKTTEERIPVANIQGLPQNRSIRSQYFLPIVTTKKPLPTIDAGKGKSS